MTAVDAATAALREGVTDPGWVGPLEQFAREAAPLLEPDQMRELLPLVRDFARRVAADELRRLACDALESTPGAAPVVLAVADLFARAAEMAADDDSEEGR